MNQPLSGAQPPPATINITLNITLNADVPIPDPVLAKKYEGVGFGHFNNETFYLDPHDPPLLKLRLDGRLPPNQNFGPNVYNISEGDVVQLIINNQVWGG